MMKTWTHDHERCEQAARRARADLQREVAILSLAVPRHRRACRAVVAKGRARAARVAEEQREGGVRARAARVERGRAPEALSRACVGARRMVCIPRRDQRPEAL